MITDILDYIEDYENIRAACGLNEQELPDVTLALALYRNKLSLALNSISGEYSPSTTEETLQELFDRLDATDEMYITIQQFAIYVTADKVLEAVGLRAYKTISDGKSNITRFSPESTYKDTRISIKENLTQLLVGITGLFDEETGALEFLTVVTPDIDLVTGE